MDLLEDREMKCPMCKGIMSPGKTTLPYEFGNNRLIVIKGVPALVCEQCGEVFVDISVARIAENIAKTSEKEGVTLGFVEYRDAA